MKLPELSMFVPAYNEAENLSRIIPTALSYLSRLAREYELLVIYDRRSRDKSLAVIEEFGSAHPQLGVIMQAEDDPGYGRALALGFQSARHSTVFYTDADNQYELSDLEKMLPYLQQADLVIGYRSPRLDPPFRLLVARLYNALARAWFNLRVHDIDCSFKLIKKDVVSGMNFICRTGAVEIELLLRARGKRCRLIEVPVRHRKRAHGASVFEAGKGKLLGLPEFGNMVAVFREMLLLKKIYSVHRGIPTGG